jgi:hypothetical protein
VQPQHARLILGLEDQTFFGFTAMRVQKSTSSFALCVHDDGSDDLEQRELYQVLPDRAAAREGYLRVVDESGEDYRYPSELFVPVRLPVAIARRLVSTARRTAAPRSAKLRARTSRVRSTLRPAFALRATVGNRAADQLRMCAVDRASTPTVREA